MESVEAPLRAEVDEHMPPRRIQALSDALLRSRVTGIPRFVLRYDSLNYDHVEMPDQTQEITDIVFPGGRVIDMVAKARPRGL